jgi:tetratricopeptide (TPR) repeat protein
MILSIAAAVAAAAPPAACPNVATPDALVCRAMEAKKAGNEQGAALAFEEAARATPDKDPKAARLWAAAGNLWIAAGQPGKAAFDLDRALAQGISGPERGEVLLDRARAAEAQGDLKTARTRLNDARAMIAEDPFYWYFSAALAIRENDAATAQSSIGEALKLAPSDPTVLFEAGHVAHFAGDETKARYYWQQAASADPNGQSGKAAREALGMLAAPATVTKPAQPPK